MKKVAAVGVTELKMPFGSIVMLDGNELHFGTEKNVVKKVALPGRPKWMRDDSGRIVPVPDARFIFVLTHELAVNPYFQLKDRKEIFDAVKVRRIRRKVRRASKAELLRLSSLADGEMLKKCKWVCNVYRSTSVVLDTDEPPRVRYEGRFGACAYQEYGTVGG